MTPINELYLRDKVMLADKVMSDLNGYMNQCSPSLQQNISDSIVDVFNLQEALHSNIDLLNTIDRMIYEAQRENYDLRTKLLEVQRDNDKLHKALDGATRADL